jgi:hypothetical protein
MEYKLTDNFLDEQGFNQVKSTMTDNSVLPWYFNDYVLSKEEDMGKAWQFTHTFFNHWRWQSDYVQGIAPLIDKIDPKAWLRIKANLGIKSSEIKEQGWHTDYDFPCTTAVFYLNDNDGYTIFEDGTKVESKANRLVEFESHHKHSGTTHTNTLTRVVINMNYIKEGGK